jgi:hypothetical protein
MFGERIKLWKLAGSTIAHFAVIPTIICGFSQMDEDQW